MAVKFDGADDVVNCGSNAVLDNIQNAMTAMAWINIVGFGENGTGRIFNKASGWLFFVNTLNSTIRFISTRATTNGDWVNAPFGIATSTTYHVAVTYNGSDVANNAVFYVNGVLSATTVNAFPVGATSDDSASDLLMGNTPAGDRAYNGWIEDARVYSRILSADEILTIKNSQGRDGIRNSMIGRWMGQGQEAVAVGNQIDLSGNSNTGVPSNGPVYAAGPSNYLRRSQ
jgi:hypothetical protein